MRKHLFDFPKRWHWVPKPESWILNVTFTTPSLSSGEQPSRGRGSSAGAEASGLAHGLRSKLRRQHQHKHSAYFPHAKGETELLSPISSLREEHEHREYYNPS